VAYNMRKEAEVHYRSALKVAAADTYLPQHAKRCPPPPYKPLLHIPDPLSEHQNGNRHMHVGPMIQFGHSDVSTQLPQSLIWPKEVASLGTSAISHPPTLYPGQGGRMSWTNIMDRVHEIMTPPTKQQNKGNHQEQVTIASWSIICGTGATTLPQQCIRQRGNTIRALAFDDLRGLQELEAQHEDHHRRHSL